jgi:hypothetical protein
MEAHSTSSFGTKYAKNELIYKFLVIIISVCFISYDV